MKSFNTTGPCDPEIHYMLPPLERMPEPIRGLIDTRNYFVLHAPRQTGKTTLIRELSRTLTAAGRYAAVQVSMQRGAGALADAVDAQHSLLESWRESAEEQLPAELLPPPWPETSPSSLLGAALATWARSSPRPLVLFLDEIDALEGSVLNSVLHQLREGFVRRPKRFPSSVALIGLRDVADYKYASGAEAPPSSVSPSPFNILVESLTLRDFTLEEVGRLYRQHTEATGQVFDDAAVARAFELSQGQPWIVNALARTMVTQLAPDPSGLLTMDHVDLARRRLIERRDAHLSTLARRLQDTRVSLVLSAVLSDSPHPNLPTDDVRYAIDIGLVRIGTDGTLEVSNPIYREVLLQELIEKPLVAIPRQHAPAWMTDGRLDPDKLLQIFSDFWRQHGSALMATADFPELAPHIVVLAFLQRVANGGGWVNREHPAENGRMDVFVELGDVKLAVELKVWRDKQADPLQEGLQQLERYMRHINTSHGWLITFDRRSGQDKLVDRMAVEEAITPRGLKVAVLRA